MTWTPSEGVHVVIDGPPTAKGRPRVFVQRGRMIATTPPKTRSYEDLVKDHGWLAMIGKGVLGGPLRVTIKAYVQMPAKLAKHKMNGPAAEKGVIRPTTRPDIDNYAKGVLDALNRIVWQDDGQIVELTVSKYYSARPRLELTAVEI